MLNWYVDNFKRAQGKRTLLVTLGFLYALELINLLSWRYTPFSARELEDSNWKVYLFMLLGGLFFSFWVYFRNKLKKNLQFFLRISILGQAVFMALQGFAIRILDIDLFVFARCGWGVFFVSSFGLIISILTYRVYPRQRTWAYAFISLSGIMAATFFLLVMAVFADIGKNNNYILFYLLGATGFFLGLFFKKILFGEPIDNEKEDDNPLAIHKLLTSKIPQTLLPLIGIGLFTYFVFDILTEDKLASFGYVKPEENQNDFSMAVRYFSTFVGTAVSCWLSFNFKKRKLVLAGYMLFQLISLGLLARLFYLIYPIDHTSVLILLNALVGFSTGIFVLAIQTTAESFGNRLRPTATILVSSLYRGTAFVFSFGLLLPNQMEYPVYFSHAALWMGITVVVVGIFSVTALDSSNFDGNADLRGFDVDIFNPDESKKFLKVFDEIEHQEWLNPLQKEQFLEECNKRILENLRPVFGDWIYHCVLYEYDQVNNRLDSPTPQNNPNAWLGLKAGEPQFSEYLSFARWMLQERGEMKSLIETSFKEGNDKLEGVILHNLSKKYNPPEGFACIDLAGIRLPCDAKTGLNYYLSLSDEKLDKEQRLEILNSIESQVDFHHNTFNQLLDFGFSEDAIDSLRRNFIIRKIESLQMPGEYFLTYMFTKNDLKVALVILAANEKIQSKLLEINAIVSAFMNIRGAKLYARYLQESYLDREVVLPGLNNGNIFIQIRDIVALELHDGFSTLYYLSEERQLQRQNINIDLEEIPRRFFIQAPGAARWTPGTLIQCHRRYFVNLHHSWRPQNPVAANHINRRLVDLVKGRQGKGGCLILNIEEQKWVVPVSTIKTRDFILSIIRPK